MQHLEATAHQMRTARNDLEENNKMNSFKMLQKLNDKK
jgi:hypothetical protein